MRIKTIIVWITVISLVAMTGCTPRTKYGKIGKPRVIRIAEINDNPRIYINEECRVKGYVTAVKDFPYLKPDAFKIFDGTDEIWIYTNRGLPPLNFSVIVKGKLKNLLGGLVDTPISVTIPIINKQIKPEIQFYIELEELEFE